MKSTAACLTLCCIFLAANCTKNVKDQHNGSSVNNNSTTDTNTMSGDGLPEKKYLKEGFINKDTYRIVIVSTKEDCETSTSDIKGKASKRALVSLKKYIESKNRSINQNTNAHLLSLIENNGDLAKKNDACKKYNVYYFDIKKSNLNRYLTSISE